MFIRFRVVEAVAKLWEIIDVSYFDEDLLRVLDRLAMLSTRWK